ncbi:MAG: hypothetical protein AAGA54_16415 [Myxococcota bacterium]
MLAPIVAALASLAEPEAAAESEDPCACAPYDVRCRERTPACWDEGQPEPRANTPPPPPPPAPWPGWRRRGLMLRASTGLMHCAQEVCNGIPMGGMARLDAGYRIGLISIWLTVDGGGGLLDIPEFEDEDGLVTGIRGGLSFFYAGAGMALHPMDLGRVDPFVGVSLGFSRVEQRFRSDQRNFDLLYTRGGVTPSGGLDVYVAPRVAVGPRVDVVLPFGGSQCVEQDGQQDCVNTVDIVDTEEAAVARARRRTFPRPWSASVQVTVYVF